MIAVDAIASRYTVAGRCARSPGFAAAIAYWRARGIVYIDPTPELLAVQAEKRRRGPRPGASFGCLCPETRLHDYGSTCTGCSMNGTNWLRYLVKPGTPLMIWRDDYGSNGPEGMRYRLFSDGRDDEPLGVGPWAHGGRGA